MKKIKKLCLALTLAASFIAAPMFAQVSSLDLTSNAYNSTKNTIRTDTENFLDVRYFDKVNFNKVFLATNFSENLFNLGAATKVKDYYLAGFYSGDFWYDLSGSYDKKSTINSKYDKENKNSNYTSNNDSKKLTSDATNNDHRIIFMIGFPNKMGLKLDSDLYFHNNNSKYISKDINKYELGNQSETINNPNYYNYNYDTYKFNLLWSCFDFEKEKINLKPWARVGLIISYDKTIDNKKTFEKNLNLDTPKNNVDKVTDSQKLELDEGSDYKRINVNLGTDFTFKGASKLNQLLILDYGLNVNFYNKTLSTDKTVTTDNLNPKNNTIDETVISRDGKQNFTNSLNATYKFDINPIEKLTVAGRVGLGTSVQYTNPGKTVTTITNTNKDGTKVTVQKDGSTPYVTKDGKVEYTKSDFIDVDSTSNEFITNFNPTFGIGVKYAVKPNFVLNLGYSGYIPSVSIISTSSTRTKTTTTRDLVTDPENPTITNVITESNTTKNVKTTTDSYESYISTGFTWGLADCCALDVAISISRTPSLKQVWDAGWNLGFTFKK